MSRVDRLPDLDTLTNVLGSATARAIFSLLEAGAPEVRPGHPWAVAFGGRPHTVAQFAAIAGRSVVTMYRDLAKASRRRILRLVPGPTRAARILEFAVPWPPPSSAPARQETHTPEDSYRYDPAGPPTPSSRHPGCCPGCAAKLQVLHDQLAALTAQLEQTLAATERLLATPRPAPAGAIPTAAHPRPVTPTAQSASHAAEIQVARPPAPPSPSGLDTHTPVAGPTPTAACPVLPRQASLSNDAADHSATASRIVSSPPQSATPSAPVAASTSPVAASTSTPKPMGTRLPEPVLFVFRDIIRRSPTPSEAARIAAHLDRFYAAGADMGDLIRAMYVAQAKYKPTPDRPRIECAAFFDRYFYRELRDVLRRRYGHPAIVPSRPARRPVPASSNVFLRRSDRAPIDYEALYLRPPWDQQAAG